HSATSAAIAAKRGPAAAASIVVSACAARVSVLPTATPTRRTPKSNASTVASGSPRTRASPVADGIGKPRDVDAEQAHRGRKPPLRRQPEHHVGIGLDGEPRVLRELVLELARRPPGVTERHEHVLRSLAARGGFEDVLRRRETD